MILIYFLTSEKYLIRSRTSRLRRSNLETKVDMTEITRVLNQLSRHPPKEPHSGINSAGE